MLLRAELLGEWVSIIAPGGHIAVAILIFFSVLLFFSDHQDLTILWLSAKQFL